MPVSRVYHLDRYSIPELLQLLRTERGEKIRLETGAQASLTIKGQAYEIDGPPLDEEAVDDLLRPVTDTRQMRTFRKRSTLDIIYRLEGARFLVRVVRAFGIFNIRTPCHQRLAKFL